MVSGEARTGIGICFSLQPGVFALKLLSCLLCGGYFLVVLYQEESALLPSSPLLPFLSLVTSCGQEQGLQDRLCTPCKMTGIFWRNCEVDLGTH